MPPTPRSRGAAPSRGRLFGGFALLILAALSIALPFHLHHHVDSTTNCPPQLPSDAVQAQHLLQLAQENIDRLNSLANESWADAGAASSAAAVAEPPRVAPTAAALPLATTRPAAASASSLWLRLVLVSVARKGAPDYLVRSLRSIVESLPSSPSHPMRAATEVVAMNNNEPPDAHRVFHDAERELGNLARFVVKRPARPALDCPKAGKLRGAVQKQTCDLVATFETLLQLQPPSETLLMLEDDWLLCPNGMLALQVTGRHHRRHLLHYLHSPQSHLPEWHPRAAARHREGVALRPALARIARLVRLQRRVGAPGRRALARRPPPLALREKGARPSSLRVVLG